MEIDITDFFNQCAPMDYSASRAEIGDSAGAMTWRAAMDDSEDHPLIATDDEREEFRAHIKGFGAWDSNEIAAMSHQELNALMIQMVAGDMRECGLDVEEPDWVAYEENCTAASRIFLGDDGRVYYYIGD